MEQREMDIWERMGTRMLAQAVLEATSVRKVETKAMMKLTRRGSRLWKYFHQSDRPDMPGLTFRPSSWRTMYLERPVFPVASARAKPPPRRRMTPQGSLFSTVFQSSRAGEESCRLNCLGRRKASATMKTAGVAL